MALKRSGVQSPSAPPVAGMAELVYALVSKTSQGNLVRVRFPLPAFFTSGLATPTLGTFGRLNPVSSILFGLIESFVGSGHQIFWLYFFKRRL